MTAEQVLAERDRLLGIAAPRIAPLQDAVDLNIATADEVALLTKWKQYRVALNRLQEQEGYPASIAWPVAPDAADEAV
ncbi:tail fiber assembly protein [Pseudomonas fakonensis]|uniref:Tail fiber assembly protein n=2 Tax=Pseudomonas fakonensis TaxID=2842355 RepID=A0ABX8NE50_9PSED|nr:tail fiber assembly protein [Pseudomonas fakonensis]